MCTGVVRVDLMAVCVLLNTLLVLHGIGWLRMFPPLTFCRCLPSFLYFSSTHQILFEKKELTVDNK